MKSAMVTCLDIAWIEAVNGADTARVSRTVLERCHPGWAVSVQPRNSAQWYR